jgi:succinate dehydrogenase / fumarate reductase iron-sulfur subunit
VTITLRIQRFNPESDPAPHFREYAVEVEPTDRVLDALMSVKSSQDGTLAFRKSCGHGVCGSDAMIIDGKERLACKTLVRDVAAAEGQVVTIQPLKHLPVQRDLMVAQGEFFARWRSVKPYLISDQPVPEGRERLQSQEQRLAFEDPTKCILCAACFSACPVLDSKNPRFIGPAAIANAARFVFDSRDTGLDARRAVLDQPDGVWACENHFQCTRVCPRGIKVTKNINLTKRRLGG